MPEATEAETKTTSTTSTQPDSSAANTDSVAEQHPAFKEHIQRLLNAFKGDVKEALDWLGKRLEKLEGKEE